MFHGHWHSFRVRCQPTSCSIRFAWLGRHPSLATHNAATVITVEVFLCLGASNGSCVRITTLGQLPGRDHAVQKRWSCEAVGSDQFSKGDPGLCWGRSGFNWLLIWHFMNSGIVFQFVASHHVVIVLLGVGAIVVLPLARMPLLKLCWQRATNVLSSCVCYIIGPFGPTSLQQKAAV